MKFEPDFYFAQRWYGLKAQTAAKHIVSLPISLGGQKIHSKVMAPNKGIFVGAYFEKIVKFAPLLSK